MKKSFAKSSLIISVLAVCGLFWIKSINAQIIVVPPSPTITTSSLLPTKSVNQPYSLQLGVDGGVSPYSWSLISGLETATKNFSVVIGNESTTGFVYTRTPTSNIVVSPLTIRVQGVFGVDFCENPGSTYYRLQYYNIDTNAQAGAGPFFHAQGDIVDDTFPLYMNVDTYHRARIFCDTPSGEFSIYSGVDTILNASGFLTIVPSAPTILTASLLTTSSINQPYSLQLEADGGASPYSWNLVSGNLPPGLSLASSGLISGIPITLGTFNFTIQVTDTNTVTSTKSFAIIMVPYSTTGFLYTRTPVGNIVTSPLTIRVQGVFGVDFCINPGSTYYRLQYYNVDTNAQGNSGPFYHAQGDIVDDTFLFYLDAGTYHIGRIFCDTPSGQYIIYNVDSGLNVPSIIISTSNLTDGIVGTAYAQTMQVSGGIAPWTWSITSGSLPSGLSLNSLTGEISGIPTAVEIVNFTVRVMDANNNTATKDLSIIVHGNTPVGSDVPVGPLSGVTLTFSQVTAEGQTAIASSSSGMTPPSGFKLGNPPTYYSISTTAEFTPPVEICINYDDTQFKNEKNLKLFHFENGQWINITTSLDTTNNIICGQVSSFSDFGLFEDITVDHIIDEVKSFSLEPDIEQGLLDKLNAAKSAIERGQNKTARNILKAFINLVNAQEGKKITNDQANILRTDAQALINSLGGNLLSAIFKWVFFGWLDKFVNAVLTAKL